MPVVTLVARLTALMAFAASRELMKSLLAWAPSSRSVLRIVDAVGAQARPFLEQAPPPDEDGEVLVITVDGKGAPAISSREYARRAVPHGTRDVNRRHARRKKRQEHPRKRRGPGKKSKNAKMAAVGVLYTLRRAADGRLEGPANKRTYATFVSYRALFEWIHAEARRRGYGTKKFKKVLFIADGAEVLWSLQQEFFPDADVCLDWFHVVEKLWKAGKAICRGTRRERQHLEAWVAEQKRSLRHGKHAEVAAVIEAALEATPVTGPGNKYRREVLAEVAAHLRKNAARLEYSRLRRQDLDISSGIIEGRYVTSSVSGSTAPACGGVAIAPRPSSSSAASSSMASGVTSSNSSVPVGCVSRLNLYRPGRMTPCSRKPRSDHETIGCTVGSAPNREGP